MKPILVTLAFGALLVMAGAQQRATTPEALFGAAIHQEEAEGNLEAAIATYKQFLARHASNRPLAAKAQLHLGLCYEKLGNAEARKAYERVLSEYPEQPEPASQARARLAALGPVKPSDSRGAGEKAVLIKELRLESSQEPHALSPDGNKIAYTKRGGNLVVRDLVSGAEKQVTNVGIGYAIGPVWSPDGKKIVYTHWQEGNFWKYEMRIVSLETGEDQHREINGQPYDWSKDGRFILYGEGAVEKRRATLNLLPVEGGPIREIMSRDASKQTGRVTGLRLSLDGKYVAYSRENDRTSNLFLLPAQGGEPIRITEGPFYDYDPIWAPDAKMLLFVSNRSLGRFDLWGVRVLDAKASGEPFIIKPDLGRVRLFSLTEDGRLLFSRSEQRDQIYLTEIDPETGQAVGDAVRLTKDSVRNWRPTWSPDGKRIAYTTSGLRVMSADGSNDRELASVDILMGPFAWAPDNDHIYFAERRAGSGTGIYSISVSTKEIKPVLLDQEILGHVVCSPDGKRLAFIKGLQNWQIYLTDIDGKNLRQVTFETRTKVAYPAWSPDGKQLAFFKYGAGDGKASLWLLSLDDGRLTEVFGGPSAEHIFWDISWSPDGSRIAWTSRDGTKEPMSLPGAGSRHEVRFMQLAPGEKPQAFRPNLGSPGKIPMSFPMWSPDGKKMVFVAGTASYQLLLMDNFLPKSPEPEKGNATTSSR